MQTFAPTLLGLFSALNCADENPALLPALSL